MILRINLIEIFKVICNNSYVKIKNHMYFIIVCGDGDVSFALKNQNVESACQYIYLYFVFCYNFFLIIGI